MEKKQHSNTPTIQHSNEIVVGIITISDRASAGEYTDLGGPALKEAAQKNGWRSFPKPSCRMMQNAFRKRFDLSLNKVAA